jgi:hypothetical protein
MKNILTSLVLLLAAGTSSNAQTATNFTAVDCNSVSHTLFTELDAGKIVVMTWVMPCGACEGPALGAYNVVQSYATSNPGKVVFYLVSDYGDDNCTALTNWVTANSLGNPANMSIFSNAANVISMSDYGTDGMPKTVVLGGPNHKVYFNENNSAANDTTALREAVDSVLNITTGVADLNNTVSFEVSPNPMSGNLAIASPAAISRVTIIAMNGQVVKEEVYAAAKINPSIDLSRLPAGTYMIKLTDADNRTGTRRIVKQ